MLPALLGQRCARKFAAGIDHRNDDVLLFNFDYATQLAAAEQIDDVAAIRTRFGGAHGIGQPRGPLLGL